MSKISRMDSKVSGSRFGVKKITKNVICRSCLTINVINFEVKINCTHNEIYKKEI